MLEDRIRLVHDICEKKTGEDHTLKYLLDYYHDAVAGHHESA
jgi:hypothetical protein